MPKFVNPILCPISNEKIPMASEDILKIIFENENKKEKCYVSSGAFRNFLSDIHKIPFSIIPFERHLNLDEWIGEHKISSEKGDDIKKRLLRK